MKKLLLLILAAALCACALTGCSDSDTTANTASGGSGTFPGGVFSPFSQTQQTEPDEQTEPEDEPASPDSPVTLPVETQTAAVEYTVKAAEWTDVEWESYTGCPYFTLTVPKGWKVTWAGNASQLEWSAKKADETVGVYNLDHNYAAKDPNMVQALNMRFALTSGTVREYFETVYGPGVADSFVVQNSCVPDNKAAIQAARPNTAIRDYQSLYATFYQNGLDGEGVYSAVIMESPDVYVRGYNYGVWEINCTFTEWAPRGELVNWEPVLAQIAQSFAYTDYYVQEWRSVLNSSATPGTSEITDSGASSAFDERSTADTILQEKRSDMLGEYERVYDNETGQIYRAYLGFLDDLGAGQTRYRPITDDEYAKGYVGYIDRP